LFCLMLVLCVCGAGRIGLCQEVITLILLTPEYGPCGRVSVNGYVGDSTTNVTRLEWAWGDSTENASWFPAEHSYRAAGQHLVTVTAYSASGLTKTVSQWVTITNAPQDDPGLVLACAPPQYGDCGAVMFQGIAAAGTGTVSRVLWAWGDGTTSESGFPALHTFRANGAYSVQATLFSTGCSTRTVTNAVVVNNVCPQADNIDLTLWPPAYEPCGAVSISGGVGTKLGDHITRVLWNWGDGITNASWFAAQHPYASNGCYLIQATAFSDRGESKVESLVAVVTNLSPECGNTFRVYPPMVFLKDGKTNEVLHVDLRTSAGLPIAVPHGAVTFRSSKPALAQVDANGSVVGAGLGEAQIEVSLSGQPRKVVVPVIAGSICLEPSILLLSTNPAVAGQLTLRAFNADGSKVELAGRQLAFSGGNAVASVSQQGLVTPLRPPASFWESPYLTATLDGMPAGNACFVRVTASNLNLTLKDHVGASVTLRVANQVGPFPYEALMDQLQVVQVVEALYRLQSRLTGGSPGRGARQYFVLDPGLDADGTVPCGLSGNPVRLGIGVDNLRSCFAGADWIQWGVIGHELGHDFLYQNSFGEFLAGLSSSAAYSEGMATALVVSCLEDIISAPDRFGLTPATLESFGAQWWYPLVPVNVRQVHYQALAKYEANPNYATSFTADLCDATMLKLEEEYGASFLFRLMSVFYPPEERFMSFRNETDQLTFWVAACSAAAQSDLRARFRDRWGYPIDEVFYARILPLLQQRASQRDPVIRDVWRRSGSFGFKFFSVPDSKYAIQKSTNLVDWVTQGTIVATGFETEAQDPLPTSVARQFYRVIQLR
jgi:PKD repeat protein